MKEFIKTNIFFFNTFLEKNLNSHICTNNTYTYSTVSVFEQIQKNVLDP